MSQQAETPSEGAAPTDQSADAKLNWAGVAKKHWLSGLLLVASAAGAVGVAWLVVDYWPWWPIIFVFLSLVVSLIVIAGQAKSETQDLLWFQVFPRLVSTFVIVLLAVSIATIIDSAFPQVVLADSPPDSSKEIHPSVLWYLIIRTSALLLVLAMSFYFIAKSFNED